MMYGQAGSLLIVDDDPLNRTLLSVSLQEAGYTIEVAENGFQALTLLQEQSFDAMLLDLLMPEVDGYQVLASVKSDPDLRHIPIIIISSLDDMDSVVQCIEMGATDYLPKPFDPILLQARLNASLASKRLRDLEVELLQRVQTEKQRADDLLNIVIPLGVALAGELRLERLLDKIVREAMHFSHADAGILYTRNDPEGLAYKVITIHSQQRKLGGTSGLPINLAGRALTHPAADRPLMPALLAAITQRPINIGNVYASDEPIDTVALSERDAQLGYHTRSLLAAPLENPAGQIIGVLELLNAQPPGDDTPVPFDTHLEQMIGSLSLLAAVALDNYLQNQQLRQELARLRIEIDRVKAQRQVEEITQSDYFREIKRELKILREHQPL